MFGLERLRSYFENSLGTVRTRRSRRKKTSQLLLRTRFFEVLESRNLLAVGIPPTSSPAQNQRNPYDATPLELFVAGVQRLEAGLRRQFEKSKSKPDRISPGKRSLRGRPDLGRCDRPGACC